MAKNTQEALNWVNYRLPAMSQNAGELRKAKVGKRYSDNTLNLTVALKKGDFSQDGRVYEPIMHKGVQVAEILHSRIIDGYLFVNKVSQGDDYDTWSV